MQASAGRAMTEGSGLTVYGGRVARVETDTMAAERARLLELAAQGLGWAGRIDESAGQGASLALAGELGECAIRARELAGHAERLAASVDEAALRYGETERSLARESAAAEEALAFALGAMGLPSLAVLLLLPEGWRLAQALVQRLLPGAGEHVVPRLIRSAAAGVDELLAGMLVPLAPPLAQQLRAPGQSQLLLRSLVAGLRSLPGPLLEETPVRLHRVGQEQLVDPPEGLEALVLRIPDAGEGGPQIRIERYGSEQEPCWFVYLAGTADASLVPGSEPWDMTSNAAALAGEQGGSMRAVLQALEAAGAREGDVVVPVGYSQGGLLAAGLAIESPYAVPVAVTVGAPVGQLAVPSTVLLLSLEHEEDWLPLLGGQQPPGGPDDDDRVLVRRSVAAELSAAGVGAAPSAAAHARELYRRTAAFADASAEARILGVRRRISALAQGPGGSSLWRAERVMQEPRREAAG